MLKVDEINVNVNSLLSRLAFIHVTVWFRNNIHIRKRLLQKIHAKRNLNYLRETGQTS